MAVLSPQKKGGNGNGKKGGGGGGGVGRFLVTVTVMGSAGPIRFVVNEVELVGAVIHTALKCYARERRLPVLGSDFNNFLLCPNPGFEALNPWEQIGARGIRNFVLCKKPEGMVGERKAAAPVIGRKGSGSFKAWLNKSLGFMIPSH